MCEAFSGESVRYRYRLVTVGAVPAAGAAPAVSPPSGQRWRVLSVLATLTTSIAVANRLAHLRLSEGGAVYADVPAAAVQAASLAVSYTFAPRVPTISVGVRQAAGMPEVVLGPGQTLSLATDAVDAADQWSAITAYVVAEYLVDGPTNLEDSASAAEMIAAELA